LYTTIYNLIFGSLTDAARSREYTTTKIDVELPRHHRHRHEEREFAFERPHQDNYNNHLNSRIDIAERDYRSRFQPNFREQVRVETTVDSPREEFVNDKMGYYDEDGI
jgi:hypothetical protein